jgi:carbon monoxide dehydrogenase subunit G
MKINNEFTVSAPIDRAWEVMLDLEKITPCLPGASIQEQQEDGTYKGTMKVKIGPITANYKGTVAYEETDEANHRAVLKASGRDARGQGTASATITSTLDEEGDKTRVNVETDMHLTGRAAQFGRGVAQDVASKIFEQFAQCLEREISGGGEIARDTSGGAQTAQETTDGGRASQETQQPPAGAVGGASTLGNVMSSDPMVAAGSSLGSAVEGSVVSGAEAQEETTEIPSAERQAARQEAPRREPQPEPEPLDLGAASRDAILKRLIPVAAGVGALALVIWLVRRR